MSVPTSNSQAPASDSAAPTTPVNRRNWIAFFADWVFLGLSLTIVNANTTLPAFLSRLTDSKILIGSVSAIWFGGYLLPQLVAANFLNHRKVKKPHLIGAGWIGRPFFWLYAVFLLLGGINYPALAIGLLLLGFTVYVVSDAYSALAYFDLFGKTMSSKERARIGGAGQVVHGLLALGAGWVVLRLLSDSGPPFPLNYAAVFALAGVFVMASLAMAYLIDETPGEASETMTRWRDFVPQIGAVFKRDPIFVRATAVRLLAGIHAMAMPFYVIYATQVARQPESAIGFFLTAQTLGGALSGGLLGWISARSGPLRVIQISAALDATAVALALMLAITGVGASAGWLFPILFGFLGAIEGSHFLGYYNFILELAPSNERPTYMGLTNTLAGVLAVMPLLGGWLLEQTSYTTLFAVALVGVVPAVVLALTLPKPGGRAAVSEVVGARVGG